MKPTGLDKAPAFSSRSAQWLVAPAPSTRSCWLRNKHHLAARPPAVSRPERAEPSDTQDTPSRWELQQLAESMGGSTQDNALQWLDDTGRALVDEAEERQAQLAQQEASRQFLQQSSNIQPQALQAAIDETGTTRQPYYKRLMAMAQAGQVADARSILEEMEAEGMPAGARAYHGLIYAHVRAGDANGALLAIKEEYAAGIQPLPQSYAILIYAFMQEGMVREAQAVYASAVRAGVDKRPAWLMLTTQLFEHSETPGDPAHKDAMYYLVSGLDEGLLPDADLYVHIIDSQPTWVDAQDKLSEMRDLQLLPEPRHINRVLKQMVQAGFPEKAEDLVNALYADPMAPFKPDVESYNEILEGLVACTDPTLPEDSPLRYNSPGLEGWADAFKGRLLQRRLVPNMRTHALLVEAHAWEGEEDHAMHHFSKLGMGLGHTLKLTDNGISTLLLLLSNLGGYPAYLLQVLQALDADNHVFNAELEALKEDERGHTVLSRWLWTRQVRLRHYAVRPQDGLTAAAEAVITAADDAEVYFVNEVAIGVGNCAIDDEGNILAPSQMTIEQLRGELSAKELPSDGKRAELLKRVQQSRKSAPASVQAVMRRQQALGVGADAAADTSTAADDATAEEDSSVVVAEDGTPLAGVAAADVEAHAMIMSRGSRLDVVTISTGVSADQYAGLAVDVESAEQSGKDYLVVVENGVEKALLMDDQGMEVLVKRFPWLRQFLQDDFGEENEAYDIGGQKITDDEEDAEDLRDMLRGVDESLLDDDDEDLLDRGDDDVVDGELDPEMAEFSEEVEGEGDTDVELIAQLDASRIKALAEAEMMREANARAGVEMALQMLPHWVRLGGPVSLEDMRLLAKSASVEANSAAAIQVALQLHIVEDLTTPNVMRNMFLQCAKTCLQAEDFDGVDQVYVAMLDAGHEPDSAFELEVERAQERQQQEFVQRRLDEANGVAPG